MCPSSIKEFEKLLKEKISQFEKSVHYSSFLDLLFRELCISLEMNVLKKINNSLSALLTEKQKTKKKEALQKCFQRQMRFSLVTTDGKAH
ncbi:Eukaryotic translation initiation factor 3 subunit J-B [Channa argus]|uniref:Eukaryotic translation initiation factor 3 subunit J-B n=1 Tax=Channa argus TaxID=215402 RepID=A0A6G1QD96_CHAAH|nr:Eukaryotic translation initiation factor 3 subunit J-B [Channa argus]